jgi:hypothetical protein
MSNSSRSLKAAALLLSGAAIGAGGGYAVDASGAGTTATASQAAGGAAVQGAKRAHGRAGGLARLRRAVSITAVVPDGKGKFATLSITRGVLVSASANALTLREGTRRATYKTVTLTLPASTTVRLSRSPSSLAALSAGERVLVVQGPHRTLVSAHPKAAAGAAGRASGEGAKE